MTGSDPQVFGSDKSLCDPLGAASAGRAPAMAGRKAEKVTKWWLCDTGCPFDLVCRNAEKSHPPSFQRPNKETVILETANAEVEVSKSVDFQVGGGLNTTVIRVNNGYAISTRRTY